MADKKRVKIKVVVADIREGMTDRELRLKYKLTGKGLANLFYGLLEVGEITLAEFVGRSGVQGDEEFSGPTAAEFRVLRREEIDFPLFIYDASDPTIFGIVKDISDNGIRISGIATEVDEMRTFSLRADEMFQVEPILFEARCCWSGKKGLQQIPLAGFAVTNLMEGSLKDLRNIMAALSLEERSAFKKRF